MKGVGATETYKPTDEEIKLLEASMVAADIWNSHLGMRTDYIRGELPSSVVRVEENEAEKKGRVKCDYCGSEPLVEEIHNGNCPNCGAPVKVVC